MHRSRKNNSRSFAFIVSPIWKLSRLLQACDWPPDFLIFSPASSSWPVLTLPVKDQVTQDIATMRR